MQQNLDLASLKHQIVIVLSVTRKGSKEDHTTANQNPKLMLHRLTTKSVSMALVGKSLTVARVMGERWEDSCLHVRALEQ